MDHDRYIGRLLDNRYEIQEVIGVGGMAVVYKARCHRLNRLVAIKILKDEHAQDEDFRRRFHAESQAVAMLSHPNIVSVYDVSSSDDAHYIVMELIDGITLKQYMEKKGILNWKETLHFAIQIAKALEHAHSRGIVHRDIKPHNVMVLKNGSVKVADFGIARVMSKSNTLTKEALGSVHYISPEQAKGGRVDSRGDLYSLGVVMYEMITGRPPYDGESPVAVAIQHINGGAKMPSTLNPNIPGGLEQIIMKAMALDPAGRYENATAMLYDMDEFRKEPSMLFDYNTPPLDEVTRLQRTPEPDRVQPASPKTTAERVAAGRNDPPVRSRTGSGYGTPARRPERSSQSPKPTRNQAAARRRREEAEQQEARRSRVTTIATVAIIVCSIVAIIALGIFLWTGLNGGFVTTPEVKLYAVPSLVGENYDSLDKNGYEGLQIVLQSREYDDAPAGQIISQEPVAGVEVVKGTKVSVVVSLGPEPKAKTMDLDLIGLTLEDAKNYLISKGVPENLILTREEYSADAMVGKVTKTDPAYGEEIKEGAAVTIWVSLGKEVITARMPNVVGELYEVALIKLNDAGFMDVTPEPVESNEPTGTVLTQSVEKYLNVDVTTPVVVQISKGPAQKVVPYVVGKHYSDALSQLEGLGFLDPYYVEVESNEPVGTVLSQSVAADTLTYITTPIELRVSKGPKTVRMPNLLGKTYEEAYQLLIGLDFTVVTREDVEDNQTAGLVIGQSVEQGTDVPVQTEIVLQVSTGPAAPVLVTKTLQIDVSAYVTEPVTPFQFQLIQDSEAPAYQLDGCTNAVFSITLEGYGVQYYDIYINGEYKTSLRVDFGAQ